MPQSQVDGHHPLYQRGFADGQKAVNAAMLAALEAVAKSNAGLTRDEWRMVQDAIAKGRSQQIVR